MNKTLKLALFLCLVSALATGILSLVNDATAPIIYENTQNLNTASLRELYPDAKEFKEVEYTDESGMVLQAFQVDDKGYVFVVESGKGYADKLGFIIGYDNDGSNSKFLMTSNNETSGFGRRLMDEPEYRENMTGKNASDPIYMLSGATVTSTAMKDAIENTIKVFSQLSGQTVEVAKSEEPVKAEVLSVTDKTYLVASQGFSGKNEFEIVLDDNGAIVSVKNTKFNDTEDIGDAAITTKHLSSFVGMTKDSFEPKLVSGATMTSNSVINAIEAVFNYSNESAPKQTSGEVVSKTEENGKTILQVKTKGFKGENTFEIHLDYASKTILEVKAISMNDTEEIGNEMVGNTKYLAKYSNVSFDDIKNVDSVSGATITADSLKEAIAFAIEQGE